MARLLQDFGDVRIIVVPCDMHRLDAALWKARFPEALVVCPEGARKAWVRFSLQQILNPISFAGS